MAKKTLKERLQDKREELKTRSQSGNIFFIKADTTTRVRILPVGEDEEFVKEVTQFYLGSEIKGVISPNSFGNPCAIMEAYEELKDSNDDEDKTLAKKFAPRQRYLAFCLIYKDEKGREINDDSPKFVLLTAGMYQDILDLYLDEDEWGDMTDPDKGYDLKLSRTGSGKTDTEYSVVACKNTVLPKAFRKVYDLKDELKSIIPTYEETKEIAAKFLNIDTEDEEKADKKKLGGKKLKKNSDAD
jgi:hypothetical protein